MRKPVTIAADWCIADNFRLYYIGKADIEKVTVSDITDLIDLYLSDGGKVSITDITDLIDIYLTQ